MAPAIAKRGCCDDEGRLTSSSCCFSFASARRILSCLSRRISIAFSILSRCRDRRSESRSSPIAFRSSNASCDEVMPLLANCFAMSDLCDSGERYLPRYTCGSLDVACDGRTYTAFHGWPCGVCGLSIVCRECSSKDVVVGRSVGFCARARRFFSAVLPSSCLRNGLYLSINMRNTVCSSRSSPVQMRSLGS